MTALDDAPQSAGDTTVATVSTWVPVCTLGALGLSDRQTVAAIAGAVTGGGAAIAWAAVRGGFGPRLHCGTRARAGASRNAAMKNRSTSGNRRW